ncbi:MAG TPA: gluconate 2-dehydrogenase subunit 3 family protein [Flavobacteriia bacterium]|nr:gluconate 2-dehydrogenase subunit 3 family protein [Flavobacteriia bacterium]
MQRLTRKYTPRPEKIKSWNLSRRNFIRGTAAMAILSQLSILESCTKDFVENTVFDKQQFQLIQIVQNILFPKGGYGPGATDFKAHLYLIWVMQDPLIYPEDKQYILNGIKWIQETAQEEKQKNFLRLTVKEQQDLIGFIAGKKWGEGWLSYMLTLIIEAMVSDPIYGFNTDAVGVKWLHHQYGVPRPTLKTKYPDIFKTVAKNG